MLKLTLEAAWGTLPVFSFRLCEYSSYSNAAAV